MQTQCHITLRANESILHYNSHLWMQAQYQADTRDVESEQESNECCVNQALHQTILR